MKWLAQIEALASDLLQDRDILSGLVGNLYSGCQNLDTKRAGIKVE